MGANWCELLYNVGVSQSVSPACAKASADKPMPPYREVTDNLPPAVVLRTGVHKTSPRPRAPKIGTLDRNCRGLTEIQEMVTLVLGLSILATGDITSETVTGFLSGLSLGELGWDQGRSPRQQLAVKALWKRPSDQGTLDITLYPFQNKAQQESMWPQLIGPQGRSSGQLMPSGFEVIGEVSQWSSNGSQGVKWRLGRYALVCSLRYAGFGTKESHHSVRNDPSGDQVLVEGAARACIGGIFGRDSGELYNEMYQNHTIRAAQGIEGHTCWNINDWASTVGATVTTNNVGGRTQITLNGKTVIVPLGSQTVKVDGSMVNTSEPSFSWKGYWYADSTFLKSID